MHSRVQRILGIFNPDHLSLKKIVIHPYVKIGVSIGLISLLISWIDLAELRTILRNADFSYLAIAILIAIANRIFMPVKWNILLKSVNIHAPLSLVIKSYYVSSFMGLFLPPTVGSDTVRAYYISNNKYPMTGVIASIIVERIIGLIMLLLFAVLGCVLFAQYYSDILINLPLLLFISILTCSVFLCLFFISFNAQFKVWIISILEKSYRNNIISKLNAMLVKLYNVYFCYNQAKFQLLVFGILTCVEIMLPIIRAYFVALAFGVNLPVGYFFAYIPIILLLTRLPISIGGFGIDEGLVTYFLSLMAVSVTVGFGIGLVNHLIFLLVILPGGLLYLFDRNQVSKKMPTVK